MGNRSLTKSLRIFSRCSILLVLLSGWLAACSNDAPAVSAQRWYQGYRAFDIQTLSEVTCSTMLPDLQVLLQQNLEGIKTFSSYNFDISRLKFKTVKQTKDTAIVEVKGTETIFLDEKNFPSEIKKDLQLVRESGVWKWCGELTYQEYTSLFLYSTLIVVIVGGILGLLVVVAIISTVRARHNYSEFYTQSKDGVVRQIQEYETGWVRSFSKLKGSGFIDDYRGKSYSIDYASFLNQRYYDLTNGEKVLFQAEWTAMGPRARNVIRVEDQSNSTSAQSRQLVILAERVKRLRQDFRFYKVPQLQKELNTCKSFFELLDIDVKRYHIKLMDYEVILLYDIEKDLHNLSDEVQTMAYDKRLWVRILHLLLQIINVVADIIQVVSPQAAGLVRNLGRGAGRLLDSKKPPLLPPVDQ